MISIKNATKSYITCLYLETLIFWAMGTASHYEFWVFPGSKTWVFFYGDSGHNS